MSDATAAAMPLPRHALMSCMTAFRRGAGCRCGLISCQQTIAQAPALAPAGGALQRLSCHDLGWGESGTQLAGAPCGDCTSCVFHTEGKSSGLKVCPALC